MKTLIGLLTISFFLSFGQVASAALLMKADCSGGPGNLYVGNSCKLLTDSDGKPLCKSGYTLVEGAKMEGPVCKSNEKIRGEEKAKADAEERARLTAEGKERAEQEKIGAIVDAAVSERLTTLEEEKKREQEEIARLLVILADLVRQLSELKAKLGVQ